MAIAAVLVEGNNTELPALRRTGSGFEGVAYYKVNTRDPGLALHATGLPAVGDVWPWADRLDGGELDGLVCTDAEIASVGGQHAVDWTGGTPGSMEDFEGGHAFIKVTYRTPNIGTSPPTSLASYTIWQTYENSYTQFYAADAATDDPKLNGGDGITTAEGAVKVVVTRRYPSGTVPVATLTGLMSPRSVNTNAFTLPPDPINGQQIAVGAGEALYLMAERGEEDGVLVVRHHIALKPNWDYEEFDENVDGTRGPSRTSSQYPEATFPVASLW